MTKQPGRNQIWKKFHKGMDSAFQNVSLTFALPAIVSAILLCIFFLRRYLKWNVACKSTNKLEGKTVIITGANSGIGKATAHELAKRGAKVVLACRNQKKGEAVARLIIKKTGNSDVYASLLDLASLRSIREFVRDFESKEKKLNILVNNAAYLGPKASTEDGYERSFGVNYLGHFYLTYLLREKLRKCAPSRIINVCSNAYLKGKLDFEDLPLTSYNMYGAYCRSKLAQVLFNVESHRNWFPDLILSYAVHPGCVNTDLMKNWSGITGQMFRKFAEFMFKSPEEGCQTIVHCAVADGLKEFSGRYFENCKVGTTKPFAKNVETCKRLWELSLQLCGEKPTEKEDDTPSPEEGKTNVTKEIAKDDECNEEEDESGSSEVKFRGSSRKTDN